MKPAYTISKIIIICLLFLVAKGANALQLDQTKSSISYISVKKNAVAEVGYFKEFSVSISAKGDFSLNINLSSIDSGIEVRNHRLRTFLFEVIRFPKASVTGHLDAAFYKDLMPGQYLHQTLNATLSLHGVQKNFQVPVRIIALADGTLTVSSEQAVLLKANDFNLTRGIQKLAELAKLDAINTVIPVSFSFNFKR